jgi:potassium-transporting ATPase ATP-binding subunit
MLLGASADRAGAGDRRLAGGQEEAPPRRHLPDPRAAVRRLLIGVGDVVLVEAGDIIPGDGEVIEGVASVDESAITGESRRSSASRAATAGGHRRHAVLSDWLVVRVTAKPGESFLDRMIAMVEGAKRQKTPNEIALTSCWRR